MLEKEINYENALKAFEKFQKNKIDILKTIDNSYASTSSVASLDENDMDDGNDEMDVFASIKEENGILIRLFEVYYSEQGFYKDIDYDDALVFEPDADLRHQPAQPAGERQHQQRDNDAAGNRCRNAETS